MNVMVLKYVILILSVIVLVSIVLTAIFHKKRVFKFLIGSAILNSVVIGALWFYMKLNGLW